jgi:hypothetical protein
VCQQTIHANEGHGAMRGISAILNEVTRYPQVFSHPLALLRAKHVSRVQQFSDQSLPYKKKNAH